MDSLALLEEYPLYSLDNSIILFALLLYVFILLATFFILDIPSLLNLEFPVNKKFGENLL